MIIWNQVNGVSKANVDIIRKKDCNKICAFAKERMFRIHLKHLDECIEAMKTAQSYQNIILQNGLGSKQFIMDN